MDTSPIHVRNRALQLFVDRIGGDSAATIYSSAQLSKDRDIVKALHWGSVDIGAPGILKMTRFDPNANLFTLPMFYGVGSETLKLINDGPIGIRLYREMAEKTRTHLLGRPIDLGFTNLYTTQRKVSTLSDIKGLKVRVPGSRASLELYKIFGANPIVIAFPDLAIALSQGNIDAVQTTHETLRSGRLWESGVRYCFEERSSYIGYVPLMSQRTWTAMSKSAQAHITESWESIVDIARALAKDSQQSARAELIENGIEIVEPREQVSANFHSQLIERSIVLANEFGMSESLVESAVTEIRRFHAESGTDESA